MKKFRYIVICHNLYKVSQKDFKQYEYLLSQNNLSDWEFTEVRSDFEKYCKAKYGIIENMILSSE